MSLDNDAALDAAFGPQASSTAASGDALDMAFPEETPKAEKKPIDSVGLNRTHDIDELAHGAGSGLLHAVVGGYKGLTTLATTADPDKAAAAVDAETAKTYRPDLSPQMAGALKTVPNPLSIPAKIGGALGQTAIAHGASPGAATALDVGTQAIPMLLGPLAGRRAVAESTTPEALSAQAVVDKAAERQSMGAAGAAPNVSDASPQLKAAISAVKPEKVNAAALQNHLEADQLGIQLTKGQATRDPIQFSEEQNQSTHPLIAERLNAQNEQMVDAIDNIRRDASPTNVSNSARENGQVAVDALKAYDEPIRAQIKAKYQKLADANGGAIPIDTGSTISSIDSRLKKGSLTRTAANDPAVAEVMDNLRSGEPMDFESFESARSLLAGVQRKGGPAGVAAGIARDELEKMPLPASAQPLKALADDARSAAAARFDQLKHDPAYESAVDDVNNGTRRGKPSPLADTFLDDYALNRGAPKSQVDLMMSKLDDEAKGAVASHTLSAIRKGAVNASGNVLPNGYNAAMAKYADKLPSLVSPETQDSLQSLGRVVTNAKVAPAGSSVAPKSGVIVRDALQGAMEHAANAKTMGAYGVLKKVFTKDGFAKDATAPGAGIER